MGEHLLDINKLSIIKNAYVKFITANSHDDEFLSSYAIFLEAIYSNEFHSQQELSAFIGCNKAHTCRTLVKMKQQGLIDITPPPREKFELTEKGRLFTENFIKTKHNFLDQLVKDIAKDDIKKFIIVFNKICLNAKNLDQI